MAQDLLDADGIIVDSDYVNGKLQNANTKCGTHINQDIVQFFQKLMSDASLTANGLDDNEANIYQFVDALVSKVRENTFQDRGDPASADFVTGSFTFDSTFRDLDLSSIIPTGAKSVLLRVTMKVNNAATNTPAVFFRKKGNSNFSNAGKVIGDAISSIGMEVAVDMTVALDSNRVIQYNGSSTGISTLTATVAGWSF